MDLYGRNELAHKSNIGHHRMGHNKFHMCASIIGRTAFGGGRTTGQQTVTISRLPFRDKRETKAFSSSNGARYGEGTLLINELLILFRTLRP